MATAPGAPGPHNAEAPDQFTALRQTCWHRAVDAYGTSYVFRQRARSLKFKIRWLAYSGLAVPLIVGALVGAYGEFKLLALVVAIGAAVGVVQIAVSLWSIVGNWPDGYAYARQAVAANESLSSRFAGLASTPPRTMAEFQHRFELIDAEDEAQRKQDNDRDITNAERRMGMRSALIRFGKTCAHCGLAPTSMEPTDCVVCGRFRYSSKKELR